MDLARVLEEEWNKMAAEMTAAKRANTTIFLRLEAMLPNSKPKDKTPSSGI